MLLSDLSYVNSCGSAPTVITCDTSENGKPRGNDQSTEPKDPKKGLKRKKLEQNRVKDGHGQ